MSKSGIIPSEWRTARRVLAICPDNLGDVLVTTPALHAVKQSLPGIELSVLASPVGAQVARLNPDIDGVIVHESPMSDPWDRLPHDGEREQGLIAALKRRDFDGAIIFTLFRQSPLPAAYLCYLASLTPATASAAPGSLQAAAYSGEGVYLYDGKNYTRRCAKYAADDADLSDEAFSNITSSIRIVGDWPATLFVDQNYGGSTSTFTGDDPDLSNNSIGDNRASSVRVVESGSANNCDGGEGVYLYEHPNYQGHCVKLTSDAGDLRTLNFDDIVSSVRFVGRWTATLYRDLYGTGIAKATGSPART